MDNTTTLLTKAFGEAPPRAQEFIRKGGLESYVAKLKEQYKLSSEVAEAVSNEILFVLLGMGDEDELVDNLVKEVGLPEPTATAIDASVQKEVVVLLDAPAGIVPPRKAPEQKNLPPAPVPKSLPSTPKTSSPVPATRAQPPVINRTPPTLIPRQVRTMQTDLTKTQPQAPKAPVTVPAVAPAPSVAPVMIFKPAERKPVVPPSSLATPPKAPQIKEEPKKPANDPYREPIE